MDTFEIKYKNSLGEIIKIDKIARVKRKQLKDLISLQEDLIYAFYKSNAGVGNVIADNVYWSTIEKLSKMFIVVGQEKPGINISEIEDDIPQLTAIFFTQSLDENGNIIIEEVFKPSLLSELHQLDYFNAAKKAVKRVMKEAEKEEQVTI